jgi:adenylate cyclase
MAILKVYKDNKQFEYEAGYFCTIGRLDENSIQLLDELVSKRHAAIFKKGEAYYVKDLNSRNGTFVNGKQLTDTILINNGDVIDVGHAKIIFSESTALPPAQANVILEDKQHIATVFRAAVSPESEKFEPISAARSIDSIKTDYERLRILFNLFNNLVTIHDINELFQNVLDFIFANIKVERAAFLEKVNEKWKITAYKSINEKDQCGTGISISSSILVEVETRKEALLLHDACSDQRFSKAESIIIQGIKSVMCIPICIRDTVPYVLYVDSMLFRGAFSQKELEVLSSISSLLSVMLQNVMLLGEIRTETKKRAVFERLFSPNLVNKILSGELDISSQPNMQEITVMFLDIRNFTELSEKIPVEELFTTLNEFFELMAEVIFHHNGTLDKYIGDAIMAFWGAPVASADHAYNAVLSARRMQEIARSYRDSFNRIKGFNFEIGIGVNSDNLIVGYVGSSKALSYTVIGPGVNIASRLCGIAKGGEILVGEYTHSKLKNVIKCDPLQNISMKGISRPYGVFRFLDIQE